MKVKRATLYTDNRDEKRLNARYTSKLPSWADENFVETIEEVMSLADGLRKARVGHVDVESRTVVGNFFVIQYEVSTS